MPLVFSSILLETRQVGLTQPAVVDRVAYCMGRLLAPRHITYYGRFFMIKIICLLGLFPITPNVNHRFPYGTEHPKARTDSVIIMKHLARVAEYAWAKTRNK